MSALTSISIDPPDGWLREIPELGPRNTSFVLYRAPAPFVVLGITHRPSSLPEDAFANLVAIFKKRPFALTPADIRKVAPALGNMLYDFNILVCRTTDIAGRRVLFIEGRWPDETDSQSILIEGARGDDVLEVFYRAPKNEYPLHLPAIRKSLSGIRWAPPLVRAPSTEGATNV